MKSYTFQGESDFQLMRDFLEDVSHESAVVDFEENMLLPSVQATTRLWHDANRNIVGFAYVDDYNNLRFAIEAESRFAQLEQEIIEWGVTCLKKRNADTGENNTLDASLSVNNTWQIAMLEQHGFVRESLRTLSYGRSLNEPIEDYMLPPGFCLRCVAGEHEVEALVSLHRDAFGTDNMTVGRRLTIMRAPAYEPALDLVVVAPNGELAAFCICGIEEETDSGRIGFTDPVGTHPHYRRRGLGKAVITAGMHRLQERKASIVKLGTSSKNIPMQKLAEVLGFTCVSEKLWFSKEIV
jgi:ribosomal protein S18 acetylase RimI-like enzyme